MDARSNRDLRTEAVHGCRGRTAKAVEPHVPLIDLSTTYPLPSVAEAAASLDRMIDGRDDASNPVYGRLHNPTVAAFERALANLERTEASVAFGSGMAAITALLLAVSSRGRHIVAIRPLYGGSDHLLTSGLLGTKVTWATEETVAAAIRPDTALVLLETPANPTLDVVDIGHVVQQSGDVPVAVDSTFATPVLQSPVEHGATFVVHSATKFLGGHGDVLGGVVATTEEWARSLRQVRTATGGVLHPLAGYLLARGLQTLPLRVAAQQETAGEMALRLASDPAVLVVHYPGLVDDPARRAVINEQMRGHGSLVSFRVRGGPPAARRFVESLEIATPAVSLGSVDTLVQIPVELTHRVVDAAALREGGVPDDLIRISFGLESPADLWADLAQALRRSERLVAEPHRREPPQHGPDEAVQPAAWPEAVPADPEEEIKLAIS